MAVPPMSEVTIKLRASRAPTWQACPVRASWEQMREDKGAPSGEEARPVYLEFGDAVHAGITGSPYEPATLIAFDEVTPTARALKRQAAMAIEKAQKVLEGRTIVSRERELSATVSVMGVRVRVVGHLDLEEEVGNEAIDILDLKSGRSDQRAALVQMAIYAWLAQQNGHNVRDVVLLHVPRAVESQGIYENAHQLLRKPAAALHDVAINTIRLVALSAHAPAASPGRHCHWCEHAGCLFHPRNDEGD